MDLPAIEAERDEDDLFLNNLLIDADFFRPY